MNDTTQKTIAMTPVQSSQIEAVGYDEASGTLAVRFNGKPGKPGAIYHYRNVGSSEWAALSDAPSKGSHFFRNIKAHADRYPFTRIEEAPERQAE